MGLYVLCLIRPECSASWRSEPCLSFWTCIYTTVITIVSEPRLELSPLLSLPLHVQYILFWNLRWTQVKITSGNRLIWGTFVAKAYLYFLFWPVRHWACVSVISHDTWGQTRRVIFFRLTCNGNENKQIPMVFTKVVHLHHLVCWCGFIVLFWVPKVNNK